MNLQGQHALVTGASAGIGYHLARELHRRGCTVTVVARRKERLESLCAELNAVRAGSASLFVCDLSNAISLSVLIGRVRSQRIDILVNNVGRGSFGEFDDLRIGEEEQMVQLNVVTPLVLTHAVIPQMKERRSGAIVNLSSIAGFQPLPLMATYSATKAFNYTHSLALRYELAPHGIRVLTVCPGPTATEFREVSGAPEGMGGGWRDSVEEVAKQSVNALERNEAVVVPCLYPWLMSLPCRILPKPLTTWIVGRVLRNSLEHAKR